MSVVLQRCFQKRSKIYQSIASHYFLRPTVMVSRCSATKSNDTINLKNTNKPTIIKVIPRKRINYDVDYTANNYVTPIRALYEYILNPEDLEGLKVYTRRSPYQQESNPIKVFLRADVEAKALEIWGSLQNLQDKFARRKRSGYFSENQDFVKLKKALRDYQKKQAFIDSIPHHQSVPVQKRFSRVVIIAATINGINVIIKAIAFAMTGSASIFSEMIHSIADMINQIILAYGQYKSLDKPDPDHPYGFNNMTYITSLISGVGIFCFGTGLTWYHGVTSLLSSVSPTYLSTGICLLSLSMLSESGTLYFALRENTRNAKQMNMTLFEYIKLGYNPAINVVLLEDAAAVCGVGVAGVSMLASHFLESPIPDAIGSIIIGGMLGYIAYFIISTNSFALTHRSIHPSQLYAIQRDLENDICVRALFDVKATDMGNQCAMFKAEIDLDGAAIARTYLDKTDVDALLQELKLCQTPEELERFLVHHGEMVIDRVGEEIDRIERKIKKKYPTLRHVDLEVL
ncbi:hypothetical protein GJ496_003295 [Pomphorhynchus laevis]|nr:hypothetical protein GJ496_003295 [Pomphorhynchus laevis]